MDRTGGPGYQRPAQVFRGPAAELGGSLADGGQDMGVAVPDLGDRQDIGQGLGSDVPLAVEDARIVRFKAYEHPGDFGFLQRRSDHVGAQAAGATRRGVRRDAQAPPVFPRARRSPLEKGPGEPVAEKKCQEMAIAGGHLTPKTV